MSTGNTTESGIPSTIKFNGDANHFAQWRIRIEAYFEDKELMGSN